MLLRNLQGGHFYWDTVYNVTEDILCVVVLSQMTTYIAVLYVYML